MAWGNYHPLQEEDDESYDESWATASEDAKYTSNAPLSALPAQQLKSGHEQDSEDELIRAEQPEGDDDDDDDDDEDIDKDGRSFHAAGTTKEKRAAQNAIFRAFAMKQEEQITEKEVKEALQDIDDDKLSIKQLLKKQETSVSITNPRDYQTELFQRAKDDNIIAVLGTGSGKTHIATLLLRHILDLELEARKNGRPPRISFFLVNSVNLVFQQSNVLECGLGGHTVEGICGAMGASLWNRETWQKHFEKNMVIVCTAQVLVDCMMHSFINMTQINLLIFDEAHHAKSGHPYARLMKDYYMTISDPSQRPRVFGMTASPVDANTDVKETAVQLERMLNCKIATTSDVTLASNSINRPTEEIARYSRLPSGYETAFHQELKARYGHMSVFEKLFTKAKLYASELGRWAADEYWSFCFSEKESRKRELRQEFRFNKANTKKSVEKLDDEIAQLREAAEYVKNHDNGVPRLLHEDLSSKVLLLHSYIDQYYRRHGNNRCIVFVEQRETARLLYQIFQHIGGPHLHGGLLVGISGRIGDFNVSLSKQVRTVSDFRKGELNCIFSTSVAEEGLDIPQCNLVARFDLYRTMIGYVQSRGRARHQNSRYLHMIETDNPHHDALIFDVMSAEQRMKNFCQGLSGDRLLDTDDMHIDNLLKAERSLPYYQDPATGARLTYSSSLSVLGYFVACLPTKNEQTNLQPTYVVSRMVNQDPNGMIESGFQCEVILPESSPITFMTGKVHRKKALAKCSAAFQMCLELRKRGHLDANLLSTMKKAAPAMRNALLAVSEKKKDRYPMRVKPDIWQTDLGTIPEQLYLTVVDVDAGLDRPHQPLGILTRVPLPPFPSFPIYLKDDRASNVLSIPLSKPLKVTAEALERFTNFFFLTYKDITNKAYEPDITKIYYWQVPILQSQETISRNANPKDVIDMAQLRCVDNPNYRWTPDMPIEEIIERVVNVYHKADLKWTPNMLDEELSDKYIVDRGDGGRRFYAIDVMPDMKPMDRVPDNVPAYKFHKNILDYSISLFKKQRLERAATWNLAQPVMRVEKIGHRRNWLAMIDRKDDEEVTEIQQNTTYVCPEPLRISPLSTRYVAMCYVFPAIIHRLEDYLIALEACQLLDLDIGPALALEAVTNDSENSDEHGEEKTNFKSGMGPNYERLEFMGDCFLKMATSISTFVQQPDENEFEFHVRRMLMLCNKNLFNVAVEKRGLVEYIRTAAFSRRTWYPKLKLLEGKGAKAGTKADQNQAIMHSLGDKSVADVCEALIGAAFMQHNQRGQWNPQMWDEAVKAVTKLVMSEDHLMERWTDYYAGYQLPKYQLAEATAAQLDLAAKVEKQHPYHFKYPRLLRSAFIHPSQAFAWEHIPHYQRLEFLGDSLLDQAFIMDLFYNYPEKDPQWMTEHKTPMVSNQFLGAVSVKLGFHQHIRQNNSALESQIYEYVVNLKEAERESNGAVDYWTTVTEVPKCLADVVEAYVGAIFVDSEFNFSVVQEFFDMHLKPFFLDMYVYDTFANQHPATRLKRRLEDELGCKQHRIATHTTVKALPGDKDRVVAMLMIHDRVHFHGVAVSGRYAKKKVADIALEAMDGLPEYEYKKRYGCDCNEPVVPVPNGQVSQVSEVA
ncbi:endoribonuclease dcr-1 [Bimuria novae-zelandiae CBS 107.79]|uniref:Dicer-like protein 1 n=1 Tax=Bimuria novae-zelandiae CBS 107.79 TaxID=1447943 RepID=A0A6A5UKL5_9PLEO|nr:endoribonuclease dcr-1 [Bimuria novae-zelandiae CBS 107.79]